MENFKFVKTESAEVQRVKMSVYLKQKMVQHGIKAADLADELDVHIQTIYNAIKGARDISPKLAIKLANYFPEPAEFWLKEEAELAKTFLETANDRSSSESSDPLSAHDSASHLSILVDYEIEELLATPNGAVQINPYSINCVQPASYDLQIGLIVKNGFTDVKEEDWSRILKDEEFREEYTFPNQASDEKGSYAPVERFKLNPMETVTIIAQQTVALDKNFMARVGAIASNCKKGLLVSHGLQIDPGYDGIMVVTAINIGSSPLILTNESYDLQEEHEVITRILSLELYHLDKAPRKAYLQGLHKTIDAISKKTGDAFYSALKKSTPREGYVEIEWLATGMTHVFANETVSSDSLKQLSLAKVKSGIIKSNENSAKSRDKVTKAVDDIIASVIIGKSEAKALHKHYGLKKNTSALKNTLMQFDDDEDINTLRKTLGWLKLDAKQIVVDLLSRAVGIR